MAYITGSAASFADLKAAIENACKANGWALQNGILSRNGCFYQIETHARYINVFAGTGQQGSQLTGEFRSGNAKTGASIISFKRNLINFPINYEIYVFDNPQEVYCVINFNSDYYAQISFGKSNIMGIEGVGAWLTGSNSTKASAYFDTASDIYSNCYINSSDTTCYMSNDTGFTVGMFTSANSSGSSANFVHCGLERGIGWKSNNEHPYLIGSKVVANLLSSLPNKMTESTVLIPIRAFVMRSERRITTVVNLNNARYTRNDNLQPGEIVTFGNEKWKVYPWYKKDASLRDGKSYGQVNPVAHSGTFAYAIRYEG